MSLLLNTLEVSSGYTNRYTHTLTLYINISLLMNYHLFSGPLLGADVKGFHRLS
jgi:hypothetical protein